MLTFWQYLMLIPILLVFGILMLSKSKGNGILIAFGLILILTAGAISASMVF